MLGGGTAGTIAANKLRDRLPQREWQITVVDESAEHHYQPGYLFVPFGTYTPEQLTKPRKQFIADGVGLVIAGIDRVDAEENRVLLEDGRILPYDYLIIATGTSPRPDQTPGMDDPEVWGTTVHEFYTLEGAKRLGEVLHGWPGGRFVVHITEMPIKCPVAPLELSFLADAYFTDKGMRDRVEMVFVTPLEGAFTKPIASKALGGMLDERKIALEPDFVVDRIDPATRTLVSMDERVVPFDLLVTVPVNMGADFIARSGLGDELNYVPVDKGTLLSKAHDNVFAIGDASDIPASKAGSVAHFSLDLFPDNFGNHVEGRPMTELFDGHANCFIETGHGKGLLIDFNYETEPLPGRYPVPGVGPFSLLEESRMNHQGKVAFRWLYWNVLLPGRPVPGLHSHMSMAGKHEPVPG